MRDAPKKKEKEFIVSGLVIFISLLKKKKYTASAERYEMMRRRLFSK